MSDARFVPILGSCLIFFIALIGYIFSAGAYSQNTLVLILFLCVFLCALYVFSKEEYPWLKGQAFKCSGLFLIGYLIVHFQVYVDTLFKNISPNEAYFFVDSRLICKCAWLSLVGLSAFMAGYFMSKGKVFFSAKSIAVVPLGPMIVFSTILLPIWVFSVGIEYFMGGYGHDIETGDFSSYITQIFEIVLYAIPLLHARNLRVQQIRLSLVRFVFTLGWYNLILGVFFVLVMLSGDRGPIITTGLFVFLSFLFQRGLKLSKLKLGILIFGAACALTFLGIVRSFGPGETFSEKIVMALNAERRVESVSPQTIELASSVRCVHHSVNYVPRSHEYMGGRFQLLWLCSVIPSGSRWLQISGIFPQKYQYSGSANFVTWICQGDNPTYGNGTTCIADFYLDLGVFGVAVGMFVWGFWARRFDVNLWAPYLPSLFFMSFIFIYTVKAVYISRSAVAFELKFGVWLFIILFAYEQLFGKKTVLADER